LRHPAGIIALTAPFLDESRSRDYAEGCFSTSAAVAAMPYSAAAFHSPLRRGALRLFGLLLALLAFVAPASSIRAISIQIDYSYDTLGFFGTSQNPTPARTTLEFAARACSILSTSRESSGKRANAAWITGMNCESARFRCTLGSFLSRETIMLSAFWSSG
jgi:hypothetical protein